MKYLAALVLLCFAAEYANSAHHDCKCIALLKGENSFAAYEDPSMNFHHQNCHDIHGCIEKCIDMIINKTNNGSLSATPDELGGMTIGDHGCSLLGHDEAAAVGSIYAQLCHHKPINTHFQFQGTWCCKDGKFCTSAPLAPRRKIPTLRNIRGRASGNCMCNLYAVIEGDKNMIFSSYAPWSGSDCTDIEGCKTACLNLAKSQTNDGDLSFKPMGPFGPTLGDLACNFLAFGADVPKSTFSGGAQACDNPEADMGTFPTKQDFCCKNGVWPNGQCD